MHGSFQESHLPQDRKSARAAIYACAITLVIGSILVAMKVWAYVETDSAAVLSSLLDSLIDVGVSALNMGAIIYALRPPDEKHRYGHGKIEGVSALAQAALIAGSAGFLAIEAIGRLATRAEVSQPISAIVIMAISSALVILIVLVQRWAIAKSKSLALEADTAHYISDLALNAGVAATLFASWIGAPAWLDGIFALCVAFWIALTAKQVGKKALAMLLDEELSSDLRSSISKIVKVHTKVLGMHDLRTRRAGVREVINIDIELDPNLTLASAHEIGQEVEAQILKFLPNAEVMIHLDPHGLQHSDSRHGA